MLGVAALIIGMTTHYVSAFPVVRDTLSFAYAQQLDTQSDESITRYVGPDAPLSFMRYKPTDLIPLGEAEYLHVQGGIGYLRREAFDQLADMAYHFHETFHQRLVVVSSFRSFGLQRDVFRGYTRSDGIAAIGYSALPGHSEHQLGLAADLFTANSTDVLGYDSYYHWLQSNAYKRGWIQSYQKGKDIDGYVVEPWHWRYVGVTLATMLHFQDVTFAQWVHTYKNLSIDHIELTMRR